MDSEQRHQQSTLAVNLGLVANVLLAGAKTSVGILANSPALLADGVNSTADAIYFTVVRVFMGLSRKPADAEHPYGHSQLETISSLIVGAFVVTTAATIFWGAVSDVVDLLSQPQDGSGAGILALWVALATIALKAGLYIYTRRVGQAADNAAVMALSYDHRNDLLSASAVTIGIFLGRRGLPWVDPLAGALVALVILHTGIQILRESSADLMDTVPGKELGGQVKKVVSPIPGVVELEEIRAHRFGPFFVINLTIGVDGSLSVEEGDHIATEVERRLYQEIEMLRRVYVHYHPVGAPTAEPAEAREPVSADQP